MNVQLERRDQDNLTGVIPGVVMFTPPIDCDYWSYRVIVGHGQAVVGFPKFGTIGIGFAKEKDWNTNLPYDCTTDEIWSHIKRNKGRIPDELCIEAIRLIQEAATADMQVSP